MTKTLVIKAKLFISYLLTQYPQVHYPLETNYDLIMDEPQLSSTLITRLGNPLTLPFAY